MKIASVSFSFGCIYASFVSVLAQKPTPFVLLPLMTWPLIERELKYEFGTLVGFITFMVDGFGVVDLLHFIGVSIGVYYVIGMGVIRGVLVVEGGGWECSLDGQEDCCSWGRGQGERLGAVKGSGEEVVLEYVKCLVFEGLRRSGLSGNWLRVQRLNMIASSLMVLYFDEDENGGLNLALQNSVRRCGFMEYVKKSIDERALHKMEYDSMVNERQTQTTKEKVDSSKALDAKPIYDEAPMAESNDCDDNVSATGQQHTEQPESNNEGEVDQNADQCYDTRPLPAKLTDNTTTELSNQLLESENVCLKKTVAQFQKDFAKLETHCINLELQMENNVLKSGQHSQFLNEKSNEAKVKNDIDVTETINIELEHSVAKLLAENEQLHKEKEHLKQTF
ncbi:hypothetical protein Tco_0453268 [Tanacetum coccineum]